METLETLETTDEWRSDLRAFVSERHRADKRAAELRVPNFCAECQCKRPHHTPDCYNLWMPTLLGDIGAPTANLAKLAETVERLFWCTERYIEQMSEGLSLEDVTRIRATGKILENLNAARQSDALFYSPEMEARRTQSGITIARLFTLTIDCVAESGSEHAEVTLEDLRTMSSADLGRNVNRSLHIACQLLDMRVSARAIRAVCGAICTV